MFTRNEPISESYNGYSQTYHGQKIIFISGIWRLVSADNMDRVLNAVGINPRTLEMVMNADAMITIYEDIDKQWKIMSETSIIAKSLRGYRTRNFKMTANKFKLEVPKPEVMDDWDLRQENHTDVKLLPVLRND